MIQYPSVCTLQPGKNVPSRRKIRASAQDFKICYTGPMISLVAFLGNYGREYEQTRHNVAWQFAESLPFYQKFSWQEKFKGDYAVAEPAALAEWFQQTGLLTTKDGGAAPLPKNAPDKILRLCPGGLLIHRKLDQIIHTHSGKKPPLLLACRKLAHLFSAFAEEDRRGRVKGKNRGPSPLFPLSEDHLQNFLMAQMHSVKLADGSRRLLRDLKLCGAADNLHIFSPEQSTLFTFRCLIQPG